ncbi:MAG: hypothetical protein K6G12_03585 [Lachnospiraceae bacterium]|nr:hypothetical protein [Lachnospiraceae bacterium]
MFEKKENNEPTKQDIPEDPITILIKKQEKQLFYTRIMSLAVVAMAVMVLFVCVIIVPKVTKTIGQVDILINEVSDAIDNVNTSLAGFDEMSTEITTAAEGINGLVEENAEVLSDSMNKLNSIDFEGLNDAIKDLQDVVEPLANFFNKF